MDPQSFVRHLHSERENQTCHWGFDASNWRSYVHISDIYYKKPDNAAAVASDSIGCDAIDRAVSPKSTEEKSSSSSVSAPEKAQNMLDDVKKRFSLPTRKQVSSTAFLFLFCLFTFHNNIYTYLWFAAYCQHSINHKRF